MANKSKLDKKEREFGDSYAKGQWRSMPGLKKIIKEHTLIARNTIRKNKNINIRVTQFDLDMLRSRAIEEGMPYQTLISSILHKYVTGTLITKR
jgi:predicted DNA binding CopG/RHH family protein